ncbi:MAG: hypothetical protein HC836_25745 [Richelia sp. RM2_1_2]|nr:hypothetical protein [Richelia sp. RM2_1_2]
MNLKEISGHKFNAPPAGEIFDILNKNCSQWIKLTKWTPVYRGSKMINPYDDFIKIKTRPEKQDPDVPPIIQQQFDQQMRTAGHQAVLSNSVHLTGDLSEAKTYGRPFVIFPVGNIHFSWSPVVKSLMGSLFRDGKKIARLSDLIPTYKHSELRAAIQSNNEILVQCFEYYKVDLELWHTISK